MADIVLAEYRGQAWLVSGEQFIDHLLANTLPPEVSIELVACESKSEVDALWVQHCGKQEGVASPWLIHPGVTNRVRRTTAGHAVFFAQWSVLIDDDARSVIKSAAHWAQESPERPVALVAFVGAGAKQSLADLAAFRIKLIESELVDLGVSSERIVRETRDVDTVPGMNEESQRVDIVLKDEA